MKEFLVHDKSFYYTCHVSATDTHDQLYKGFFDGSGWLLLVSTRKDSKGGYDLYIAHEKSGSIYSLTNYNSLINTTKNELGPDYTSAR